MRPSLGVATPQGYLANRLTALAELSAGGGEPEEIAALLDELGPRFEEQGERDLSLRVLKLAGALRDGTVPRTVFLRSPVFTQLDAIREALDQDLPLETALQGKEAASALAALTGQQNLRAEKFAPSAHVTHALRLTIGPKPLIDWTSFGSNRFPAPRPPSPDVNTLGQQLAYFVFYVAGMAGRGESQIATADYYKISPDQLRRLQKGFFVPNALGQFPSEEAASLIAKAEALTPKYGQLMRELLILAIFESQGWSLGKPKSDASWDISFMYALRRYVATQLLTEAGKEKVLENVSLLRLVKNQNALERVDWHPGQTRREVFEPLLKAICNGDEKRLEAMRRYIGDGILKKTGWKKPSTGAPAEIQLQWKLRCWIAYHHYGAIPARGLPFPADAILRFAFAMKPVDITPEFQRGLLKMMD